jgi:hypothetical protein
MMSLFLYLAIALSLTRVPAVREGQFSQLCTAKEPIEIFSFLRHEFAGSFGMMV